MIVWNVLRPQLECRLLSNYSFRCCCSVKRNFRAHSTSPLWRDHRFACATLQRVTRRWHSVKDSLPCVTQLNTVLNSVTQCDRVWKTPRPMWRCVTRRQTLGVARSCVLANNFNNRQFRVKHVTLPVWLDTCIMFRRKVGVKVLATGFFLDKHQTLCDLTYESVMKVTVHERHKD